MVDSHLFDRRAKEATKVSFVLTCYNLGLYIEEMVESVKCQTYKSWELIIVDDGSSDEQTVRVLDKITQCNPGFTLIRQHNTGLAIARNNGVAKAKGRYIVCIDADDRLHPQFLEKTVPVLEKDITGSLGFVTTYLKEYGERDNVWRTKGYEPYLLMLENVVHGSSLVRKAAWESAGGYNSNMKSGYEDWNYWIGIVSKGYKWTVVKEILFYYRIRSNSMLHKARHDHLELYRTLVSNNRDYFREHIVDYACQAQSMLADFRATVTAQQTDMHKSRMGLKAKESALKILPSPALRILKAARRCVKSFPHR